MLINVPSLPMHNEENKNNGVPWLAIIVAAIIIGGVIYFSYISTQAPKLVVKKEEENDKAQDGNK